MNLESLVQLYREDPKGLAFHREYLAYFESQVNEPELIEKAVYAKTNDGKVYSHRCRVKAEALAEACTALETKREGLSLCEDFDEIYDFVQEVTQSVAGFGPLSQYDTALRIGANRGMLPDKVYVERGARAGARKLLGVQKLRGRYLVKEQLPEVLHGLEEYHIENFLCQYKDTLSKDDNTL